MQNFDLKKYLAEGKLLKENSLTEEYNKDSLLKALGDSDDALIQDIYGREYLIYNPNSAYSEKYNADDMWNDGSVFAVTKDGDEVEIRYEDIADIISKMTYNEEKLNEEIPEIPKFKINESILFEALIAELKNFNVGDYDMSLDDINKETRATLDDFRAALNQLIQKEPRLKKATKIIKNNLKTDALVAAIVNRYNTLNKLEKGKLKKGYDKSEGPDIYFDEKRNRYIDRRTGRFAKKEDIDKQIEKDIEDGTIETDEKDRCKPMPSDNWYVKAWKKAPGNKAFCRAVKLKKVRGTISKIATKAANIVKQRKDG